MQIEKHMNLQIDPIEKILDYYSNKNILITGGTGLIGRQLVDLLLEVKARIKIISLDEIVLNSEVDHVRGDLTNFNFCLKEFKNQDIIFHLAGIKGSVDVSKKFIASHFVPTLMMNTNALEAARQNGIAELVYTSSIGAYSNQEEIFFEKNYKIDSIPMDFAGWAKRVAELQIFAYKQQYNLKNYLVVRPSNVYGPGDNFDPDNAMVIPSLMYRILNNEDPLVVWGDGSAIRDFVYSKDVAIGLLKSAYYKFQVDFINLGSGQEVSIKDLVLTLAKIKKINYKFDTAKPTGSPKRVMDISMAKKLINYNPNTTLFNGLSETFNWYINNKKEFLLKKNYFKKN